MRQLFFNLTPSVVAALSCSAHGDDIKQAPDGVISLQPHREDVLTMPMRLLSLDSMGFDFPGRVNIKRLLGSFQDRYGRKVNPADEWFDAKYKINAYD